MANVMFKKGLLANLPASYVEGAFYVTTDERAIYLDVDSSTRIRLGDFQEFATLDALKANTNPSTTALYYISGLNVLAKWNGTEYIQINLDTGATSFEVVGSGNAVTAVSYDAVTRKLTLTKGETFATRTYVGEIPEGYTEATIIAYINKKAEEILNAASGGSSESAASVLAALNTYKAENDPKVAALEEKAHEHENKELLDTYTQTETDLADAVSKKHGHANAEELDKIASGDKDKWDKAVTDLADEITRAKAAEETNASAAKAADDKAVAAQEAVDTLAGKVGTVPADKTVVQMISDAQTAATYDDTQVKADIKANADAIDVLNGSGEGSVDKKITDAFNDFSTKVTDDAVVNSYKELIDWAAEHGSEAAEMAAAITVLQNILKGIGGEGESATVVAYVNSAIEALKIGDYVKAADLTALAERVAAMEAKAPNWDAAEQNAKDYADGLNAQMNTRMEVVEGKAHEHANKAELDKIVEGDKAKWDGMQAAAEATAAAALSAAKSELEGKITAAQTAAEKVANDNNAAMDTRVKVLEAIDHEAYVAADEQVLTDAKAYADQQINAALAWGSF